MKPYVKNTIIDNLIGLIAPHHCCSCGKIGRILCESCNYDIVCEPYSGCIVCGKIALHGVCLSCDTSYQRAWCVGSREGALQTLINDFKFDRKQQAYLSLASLLHQTLPLLSEATIVTWVPTVPRHIRLRGYDHAELLAREFAKLRRLRCISVLARASNSQQRGASRKIRAQQASRAFVPRQKNIQDTTYLLIDDIITTGASVHHAAATMKRAGANEVWVAVVARQPMH